MKSPRSNTASEQLSKRTIIEGATFVVLMIAFFAYLTYKFIPGPENMPKNTAPFVAGLQNMIKTFIATSYDLLIDTVFKIMSITVLMGALAKLLTEFGVVAILERILRPLMKPLFNLPGIAALGAVVTFLSDNPAIITLSKDKKFSQYFKTYQIVSLTNFGTAFGMGLVVVLFMVGEGFLIAPLIGVIGACVGCLISTRLMQLFTLKAHPEYDCPYDERVEAAVAVAEADALNAGPTLQNPETDEAGKHKEGLFMRFLNALLDGGKSGVGLGMAIIPGVLIISSLVMVLSTPTPAAELNGSAYQGIGLLPYLADKINFIFYWLWGFDNGELIAFPVTALGAVGAAIGLVQHMQESGIINDNAIAVFTAIGMCWSGYLSTHAAMLDSMGFRKLISKAIAAHTVAGIAAGVVAHWLWVLYALLAA